MARKETTLLGYHAWLDIDDDRIEASYTDAETLGDELTVMTREAEETPDAPIPEETGVDLEAWHRYFDALVAWVATETGVPSDELAPAFNPAGYAPYIRAHP